jgi:hypothetical protein
MVFYPHLEIAPPRAELLHTQKEDSPAVPRAAPVPSGMA